MFILVSEIFFSDRCVHSKLTNSDCIAQISHHGKIIAMQILILIVQINLSKNVLEKLSSDRAKFPNFPGSKSVTICYVIFPKMYYSIIMGFVKQ